MKSIKTLAAALLIGTAFSVSAFAGVLDESNALHGQAAPTPPLLGVPVPTQMSCSIGWNANDDSVTTAKNTPVTFSPLWNDDDTPQQNFGGILSGPAHGTAVQVGLDAVTYTPASGYTGSDSFTYQHIGCLQCYDGWCAEPSDDTATVYITVTN